ncbi:MAG: hypothetical protein ACM3X4_07430 [Ignavibacteriales bacterium]
MSGCVSGAVDGDKVVLRWERIADSRFQRYKVVISKTDQRPVYPDSGYLYYITDRNVTSAVIDNEEPYKNRHFGKYLTPGSAYYFSVTALYSHAGVAGNVVQLTYPAPQ